MFSIAVENFVSHGKLLVLLWLDECSVQTGCPKNQSTDSTRWAQWVTLLTLRECMSSVY